MTGSGLYQKNLVVLETALPAVARLARENTGTITQLVAEDGAAATDIDLGGGRLYNRPALEFAREQVASWLSMPDRVVVNRPDPDALKDFCTENLVRRLSDEFGDDLRTMPPKAETGLLAVIGLGLGHHVRELLDHVSPRHLVVVEPIEEFLLHSLHALDWAELVEVCRERGTTLDIIVNFDPRAVQTEMEALITRFGASCMDGAYSFLHYRTDATRGIARSFRELAGMKSILQGYYDDEKLMIENTIANVSGGEFWMIDGALRASHDLPAIIVGSGPSLDASLDDLRRLQDHAVIFCAGSALQSLLKAGIRPDFQIEKENNEVTEARMQHIYERADVPGDTFDVSLIASTTVKPGVVWLFRDSLLFHRDMLSSTRLFGAGFDPVLGTGPFSANTAVAVASVLGFRRMYFFGCDCGSVDQEQHHARETVYHTRVGHVSGHAEMPVAVPGNFGGRAWSNSYFLWSRWVFESMITGFGIEAVNCSDGIAISGARPVRSADLEIGGTLNKAGVLGRIKAMTRHFPRGTYLDPENVDAAVAHWNGFAHDTREFLADLETKTNDLVSFEAELVGFIEASDAKYGGAVVPLRGSMHSMVPVAGFFLNRARDDAHRARMMSVFRGIFREQVERMLADGTGMFNAIAAQHGAGPELRAAG